MKNNRRNTDLVHQHVRISSLRQSLYPVYDAIRCVCECSCLSTFYHRGGGGGGGGGGGSTLIFLYIHLDLADFLVQNFEF